jgi:hypothetical protein
MGKSIKEIYVVKWIDSYASERWYNDKEIDNWIEETEKELIISVGFLYKKTRKYIVLFSDESPDEKARCIKIPRGMVKSINIIKQY